MDRQVLLLPLERVKLMASGSSLSLYQWVLIGYWFSLIYTVGCIGVGDV